MKKKLFLLVASGLVSLLLAELALRLLWANPYVGSEPDAMVRLYMHHANLELRFERDMIDPEDPWVDFRTNARNYIEPAARFEDPRHTVAFVGGSTTECKAVAEDQRFPARVSTLFEEEGERVNTLNAGVSGNSMHETLNIVANHVIFDRPDVIVLMHAVNDIGVLRRNDGSYASHATHEVEGKAIARLAVQELSVHSSLLGFARSVLTAPTFEPGDRPARTLELDPAPFRARLQVFVSTCQALDIEPVLMTQPLGLTIRNSMTPDWAEPMTQDVFNQVIRDVGAQNGVTVIDLVQHVHEHAEAHGGVEELGRIFYDGVHVTDHGSELYAGWIRDALRDEVFPGSPEKAPVEASFSK